MFIYLIISLRAVHKPRYYCNYCLIHPTTLFRVKREKTVITKVISLHKKKIKYKRKWVQINRQG